MALASVFLSEYAEKLEEKYARRPAVAGNTMNALGHSPGLILVTNYFFWNLIATDPDDNKFVECAIAAGADFIVSNDRHFSILRTLEFPSVRVISADDVVELLRSCLSMLKFNIRMAGRFHFMLTKAFFAAVCGQYGVPRPRDNAGQDKMGRPGAEMLNLNML